MRYLITGGAGFLGAALANHLIATGHDVRVVDDLSAGDENRLVEGVSFTRGNINDVPRLWTLLQGVECVVHLAAKVHVPESFQYPRDYNAVNVGGTVSVLEAMRDVGVRRVVFASSGAVYGRQASQPLQEALLPNPGSPYAVSKLAAEHYVRTIGRLWDIETVSLRIFNAYGPGQPLTVSFPAVIPSFLQRMIHRGSVVIHGDGTQTRDFVYIDDVVAALVKASTLPGVIHQVINVGSGVETSINALLEDMMRLAGREKIDPLYSPVSAPGVMRMCADLTLARDALDYAPRVSLTEGLRRVLAEDHRFASDRAAPA